MLSGGAADASASISGLNLEGLEDVEDLPWVEFFYFVLFT